MNMDKNQSSPQHDLEFNNGVGDALRDKETYTFSWKKTIGVLSSGLIIVLIVTFGLIELGKKSLIQPTTYQPTETQDINQSELLAEPIDNNWDVLPQDIPTKKDPEISSVSPKKEPSVAKSEDEFKAKEQRQQKNSSTKDTNNKSVYRVIAGSYSNYKNAQSALKTIQSKGVSAYIWSLESPNKTISYKVQAGAFKSRKSAQKHVQQLNSKNIDAYISH